MARGVWYNQDFPYVIGIIISIASVVGSSYYYGKQAFTWTEDVEPSGYDGGS